MNIAVIPARGGSKGIPGKNMMMIGGKPLIFYSMQVAIDSTLVDKVVVTSDDDSILEYAESFGVYWVRRNGLLSGDDAPTEPCIRDVIEHMVLLDDDNVIMLQPTSPLRTVGMLDRFIQRYGHMTYNSIICNIKDTSLFTAHDEKYYHWNSINGWNGDGFNYMTPRVAKQTIGSSIRENGSIYITSVRNWIFYNRFGLSPYPFLIPPICGMELDYPWQVPIFNHIIETGLYIKEVDKWLGAQ